MLNRKLIYINLLLIAVFFAKEISATHLVGGFISYQYQSLTASGARYLVTIKAYRDCRPNPSVDFASNIDVCVYRRDNSQLHKTETFRLISRKPVKPIGRTDCPEALNTCLEEAIYQKIVDLPTSTFGYILKWEVCCRNTQVNLRDDPTEGQPFIGQTYQTIIPPTNVRNSSPYFSEVPVPFICINDTTDAINYAIDPDGDSLVYRLATPWYGASLSINYPGCTQNYFAPVPISNSDYRPGFNGQIPFGATGYVDINPRNGITRYFARQTGNYALAIDLDEYRNGVLLSSTRLDLQILVINCALNNQPTLSTSTSNLSVVAGGRLCFNVVSNDIDNHTVTLSGIGDILTGANGFVGNRATFPTASARGSVTSEFCWQTSCDQVRDDPYLFTAFAVDNGCPSKYKIKNYEIRVRPFNPTLNLNGPTSLCQGEKNVQYTIVANAAFPDDIIGITYDITITGGQLMSQNGNQFVVNWNFGPTQGIIEITPKSIFGCPGRRIQRTIVLRPAASTPIIPTIDTLCENTLKSYSIPSVNGYTYQWWIQNGVFLNASNSNAVNVRWGAAGQAQLKVIQRNEFNCPSDTAFLNIWISKPKTSPIRGRQTVCPFSSLVDYSVTSPNYGSSFLWIVTGGDIVSNPTPNAILVNWGAEGLGVIKVLETNRFGCAGDTITRFVSKTYDLVADSIRGLSNVCEFTTGVEYEVTFTNRSVYTWTVSGGTIINGQGSNKITVDWGGQTTGSVSMFETSIDTVNNKQCVSGVFNYIVNVRPFPIANQIVGPNSYCQSSGDYLFVLNGYANSSYLWTINPNNWTIRGQGNDSVYINSAAFGTYRLSAIETTEFGCEGAQVNIDVEVYPKPTSNAIIGDTVICLPNVANKTYSISGFANSIFNWVVNGGQIINNTNSQITVNWSGQKNNTVTVFEVSEDGCVGDTLEMSVYYDNPSLYLNYLTVNPPPNNDNGIELFWQIFNAERHETPVIIERRKTGTTEAFASVASVIKTEVNYLQTPINTDSFAYDYRIRGTDLCGEPFYSRIHTNVLLTGSKVGAYEVSMNFMPYLGWGNAAITYDIYRYLPESTAYVLYEPNVNSFSAYYNNGQEYYTQCYRVKATKVGTDTVSWSNDICFNFEPILYIPNAFTPNDDDLNDQFILSGGALKTIDFKIFNRWGELLFQSDNLKTFWNGKYKDKLQPQGVYMYSCTYTDFRGKLYSTKGTITLLK